MNEYSLAKVQYFHQKNRSIVCLFTKKLYLCTNKLTPLPVEQRAQGEPFYYMMMNKVPYPKHIQTFANQISILKQRGLMIANEQKAEKWLHKVSYYRMSGYWYLIMNIQNHTAS